MTNCTKELNTTSGPPSRGCAKRSRSGLPPRPHKPQTAAGQPHRPRPTGTTHSPRTPQRQPVQQRPHQADRTIRQGTAKGDSNRQEEEETQTRPPRDAKTDKMLATPTHNQQTTTKPATRQPTTKPNKAKQRPNRKQKQTNRGHTAAHSRHPTHPKHLLPSVIGAIPRPSRSITVCSIRQAAAGKAAKHCSGIFSLKRATDAPKQVRRLHLDLLTLKRRPNLRHETTKPPRRRAETASVGFNDKGDESQPLFQTSGLRVVMLALEMLIHTPYGRSNFNSSAHAVGPQSGRNGKVHSTRVAIRAWD